MDRRGLSKSACEKYFNLIAIVSLLLLLPVTDTAAVFLFWRVSAIAARAALEEARRSSMGK